MITETVTVFTPGAVGEDEFGEPVYTDTESTVDGVLVRQLSGSELDRAERPDGVQIKYVLAFPAGYDLSMLENATVAIRDEKPLKVETIVSVPQSPLPWASRVEVGRADG